jgi:hypothetical protein
MISKVKLGVSAIPKAVRRWLALPAGLLLIFAVMGRAQGEASIWGIVTDSTGASVPKASVTVKNVETGAERKYVTDDDGRFDAPSLAVGSYEVTVEKTGFRRESKKGITLVLGQRLEVSVGLTVGEIEQSVRIEATDSGVQVSTEQPEGLVGERQVKDLPLNGRSYDQLVTLNPGIVSYTSQRSGALGTSNSVVGNMFAVSGRRPQENLFLLNGVEFTGASEINNTPGGASGQLLGVDAVREFQVVTDAYGAEYGKRPGAQVNIVTASGTNALHGSLYEFLRNSDFDARNFFDQGAIPHFSRNDFGGALGGPIHRDKTFFFVNYEGFRQHLGLSDVTFVPDNNARNGIVGTTTVGVNASVAPLLALWPVANGPELGNGIAEAFSHPLQTIREDFGTARLDHNFSDKDFLAAVYTVDDSADNTPTANPLSRDVEFLREQVVSFSETHLFSPSILNKATFGFSRGAFYFNGVAASNPIAFIQGRPIGAIVIGGSSAPNSTSSITLAGTATGSNLPAVRNLFTAEDQVSITHGTHLFEAGVWFERLEANDSLAQAQNGQVTFTTLTSFLQGTVATFAAVPSPTPLGWRQLEQAYYAQDIIRLRPNLEVRAALRIENTDGWNESHDRASNYLFTNGVINTQPSIGNSALAENRAKFLPAPRIGIAWSPFASHKTVFRAGFGIYYYLLDDLSYRLDQTAPYNTTLTVKNIPLTSVENLVPGGTLPTGTLISPSGVQPDIYTPTIESYSFKIEQQIAPNTALTVGYVGSHGYHELLSLDANIPVPTICPASPCPASLAAGTPYIPTGSKDANPAVANTTSWFSEGDSSYNALEVDVQHQLSHGFQLRGVYTYSKSLDNGDTTNTSISTSSPAFVSYPLDPAVDWSRSTFDARHSAAINGTYNLPFGRRGASDSGESRLRSELISDWALSGIVSVSTGFPFTPQLGYNPSNDGDSRNPVRPNWNPNFTGPVILGNPNEYFKPAAFSTPVTGTFGNVGRDSLTGPGLAELDLSATKQFEITERVNLQFRAEFFNILNHANFNTPNPIVFSSAASGALTSAGLITSTSTTSRQIQFGLKLLW